jgi:hypothetical protein
MVLSLLINKVAIGCYQYLRSLISVIAICFAFMRTSLNASRSSSPSLSSSKHRDLPKCCWLLIIWYSRTIESSSNHCSIVRRRGIWRWCAHHHCRRLPRWASRIGFEGGRNSDQRTIASLYPVVSVVCWLSSSVTVVEASDFVRKGWVRY